MFGKKTFIAVLVVLLAVAYNIYRTRKIESRVVETNYGRMKGIISLSRNGIELEEFLGIPYALPPVGDLRFEPPQPPKKWTGIRDASQLGHECAQLRLITGFLGGEEDCLFLNVYAPKDRKGLLNVFVFFHGGAFITGSSNGYRPGYFMDENVLLVTVNYRLAALGFLNTGDGVVRGNMGLKDQVLALKWVQSNIEAFGGDPNRVTIFGESAGSASVNLHVLSPLSKGLFNKAIMQSGVGTSSWSTFNQPGKQAKRFAKHFDCPTGNSTEMVKCLKQLDVTKLLNAHKEVLVPLREQITIFVPTVESVKDENTFLPDTPIKILESGKFNKVPLIVGVNSDEGLLTSAIVTSNQTKLQQANDEYHFWAPRILNYDEEKTDVSDKIRRFYFGHVKNIADDALIQNYTNLFSDRNFFVPTHRFVKYYSQHVPVRLYYFAHRGSFSLSFILMASQKSNYLPVVVNVILDVAYRWVKSNVFGMEIISPGVCHADELVYFFNWPLSPEIMPGNREYEISKDLVKLWTSFAKEDKSVKFRGIEWPLMTATQNRFKYLRITEDPAMVDEPFADRVKFWDSIGL